MKTRIYVAIHTHVYGVNIYPFLLPVNKILPPVDKAIKLLDIEYDFDEDDLDYILIDPEDLLTL